MFSKCFDGNRTGKETSRAGSSVIGVESAAAASATIGIGVFATSAR